MTNFISHIFGKFANTAFPTPFQRFINAVYVKIFDIDLSKFEDSKNFTTLNKLFTRALLHKRDFDKRENILISPTDSLITECEKITIDNGQTIALQIKGMQYKVAELLGEELDGENYEYINLYLSPRDYHRYHAPCDMQILQMRYFSGELLPVNYPALNKHQNLFVKNERVVVKAKMNNGKILYFVAVGALNVGSIVFHAEPKIITNAGVQNALYAYEKPIFVKKGDELGMFNMGSTIVLFVQDFVRQIKRADKVQFSQTLGELK